MEMRFGGSGSGAAIGCGALLVVLGLVLLSPFIDWLITGLGYTFIVLGAIGVLFGVLSWVLRGGRS